MITILLSGCETGGEGSQFSANGSPDSPLNGQRHFSREVRVQFFSPELGRPTDYPYLSGTQTNRQVRAQENPLDRYVQVVRTSPGRFEAVYLQENDPSGYLGAFTPERDINPDFGGVGDSIGWFPYPQDNPGSVTLRGSITRVWTPPAIDSEKPTLLQVGGVYIPVDGPSVTVRTDWTIQWDEQLNGAVGVQAVVTVNGQEFVAENYEPSDRPGLLLGSPVFFSNQSGVHTVQETRVDVDGSVEELTWSYQQRALTLEEDLPELDMESAEPIEIRNKVVWDDGAPLDGSGVEWKVDIGGSEIPEQEKEGTGVDIYALWKPLESILERGGYVDPSTVPPSDQLVPVGAVVSAQTPVYQDYRAIEDPQLGDIVYKIIRGFQVPGKVRIKIVNETVSPEEPFEGDSTSATVNAEVIFFDPEILEEDVEWKVYLQDADGNSVFEDPLATGEGCEISATWDGTINGAEPPKDPRTYQFALEADACGGDEPDVGVFRGVRSQEVDPGGSGGGTCTDLFAQNFVPVGFRFQISDLTFGGSPEAERNGNGPYLVYDYINDKAPNNQPQWVKDGDEIVPVVMKMGTPLYMKANFQLTPFRVAL